MPEIAAAAVYEILFLSSVPEIRSFRILRICGISLIKMRPTLRKTMRLEVAISFHNVNIPGLWSIGARH